MLAICFDNITKAGNDDPKLSGIVTELQWGFVRWNCGGGGLLLNHLSNFQSPVDNRAFEYADNGRCYLWLKLNCD